MNSMRVFFFLIILLVGCDSFNRPSEKEVLLDKNKILEDFKSNFSSLIPEDSLLTISTVKDSPIKGLKEGVIFFKTLDETQQLVFFISDNGRYIIFQPQIFDFSGPIKNLDLMSSIDLKGVPSSQEKPSGVRIVEYSDFQCPACKYGSQQVARLKEEFGEKITFYFKHYPLTFHKWADDAALFTSCINDTFGQKNFWKAHDLIFANQESIKEKSFADNIKDIFIGNVNFDFTSCLDTVDKYQEFVESIIKEASSLGVNSTPTFIVEGHIIRGADYEKIKEAIDKFVRD